MTMPNDALPNTDLATDPVSRLSLPIILLAALATAAAIAPFVMSSGPGPTQIVSMRGETVQLFGYGPYRHMPAEVAVQGLAQDLVTLLLGVPLLMLALWQARRGSDSARLALTGVVGYLFVQYVLYLAMGTYNELFLLWTLLVLVSGQILVRLLLAGRGIPPQGGDTRARTYVGCFLIGNAMLIGTLWLSVLAPPLLDGSLYPAGLAHLTTMVVQGFDLALFLPPSVLAGLYYLQRRTAGQLLAPVYAVFLVLQMTALLAKIVWMTLAGTSAGPALVVIPTILVGALLAASLSLRGGWRADATRLSSR